MKSAPRRRILTLFLAGKLFACAGTSNSAAAPVPLISQTPTPKTGGVLASAEPIKPMGGWKGTYRGADDFVLKEKTEIGSIAWWGCSYDGLHGETDTFNQILGFAVEIYEDDPEENRPGKLVRREIVPLAATHPERTKFFNFGGSDVFRFTAALETPFAVEANQKYWLCIGAYLKGAPMWVWFKSDTKDLMGGAFDYGVNGVWGDEPPGWSLQNLAFELLAPDGESKPFAPEPGPDVPDVEAEPKVPSEEEITEWIEKLSSPDFLTRTKAEGALLIIGPTAALLLERLAADEATDPEAKLRARRILGRIGAAQKLPRKLVVHTVKSGETRVSVAKHYGIGEGFIARANVLRENPLFPGMMLRIPEK